jgi:hypothetical protein
MKKTLLWLSSCLPVLFASTSLLYCQDDEDYILRNYIEKDNAADFSRLIPRVSDVLIRFTPDPPPKEDTAWAATKSVEIVRKANIEKGTEHFTNASSREWWGVFRVRSEKIFVHGMGEKIEVQTALSASPFTNTLSTVDGFPGLAWMKKAIHAGTAQVNGKTVAYYHSAAVNPVTGVPLAEVWLEEKTSHPVKMQNLGKTFLVEIIPSPKVALDLPAEFQEAIEEHRIQVERRANLNKLPRR